MNPAVRRWAAVVIAAVTLIALGWFVSSAELSTESRPIPRIETEEVHDSGSAEASASADDQGGVPINPRDRTPPPQWISTLVTFLFYFGVALALAAVCGYLVYRFASTRPPSRKTIDTRNTSRVSTTELREAVQAGLANLDDDSTDPRAAVIACWLKLEKAASRAGVARLASQTPLELVQRVLIEYRVSEAALSQLVDAYHQARYAPHDITEELRQTAKAALSEVRAQLQDAGAEEATS